MNLDFIKLSCVFSAELEGAVLDSLGDVFGADLVAAGKIGDGSCDLQHAVIAAGVMPSASYACFIRAVQSSSSWQNVRSCAGCI